MARQLYYILLATVLLVVSVQSYQSLQVSKQIALDRNAQKIILSLAGQIYEHEALIENTPNFNIMPPRKRDVKDALFNIPDLMGKGRK